MMVCVPSSRKISRGRRLVKNAIFTAVFTCVWAHEFCLGVGESVSRRGEIRRAMVKKRLEVEIREERGITSAWVCTRMLGS